MKQTKKKESLFQVVDSKQALHSHSPFLINIQQFKIKMYPKPARERREFINSSVLPFRACRETSCPKRRAEGAAENGHGPARRPRLRPRSLPLLNPLIRPETSRHLSPPWLYKNSRARQADLCRAVWVWGFFWVGVLVGWLLYFVVCVCFK